MKAESLAAEFVETLCRWFARVEPVQGDTRVSGEPPMTHVKASRTIAGVGTIACVPRDQIQVIQTHISWVILVGDWALKLKKPIRTDFLDYGSLAKRFDACCTEYQLNQRMAPEIYRGVVVICDPSAGRPHVKGAPESSGNAGDIVEVSAANAGYDAVGEFRANEDLQLFLVDTETNPEMPEGILETCVLMRRFPADALLGTQLRQGRVEPKGIDQLACSLAHFHDSAHRADEKTIWGEPHVVHHDQLDNLNHLRGWIRSDDDHRVFKELEQWVTMHTGKLINVFLERKRNGMVRACHGDLHLDNIVRWQGQWVPFDGIEFNERLRWIDTQSDLAFAVMDLSAHGENGFAHRLLNTYLERTGDYWGLSVQRWYQVYRALVRAKVAAIRADQEETGGENYSKHAEAVCRGLQLAHRLTRGGQKRVLITHGLSGSGKSFLSQQWVDRFGAIRVRSDIERKRLFARSIDGPGELAETGSVGELYGTTATEATYERLLHLVREGIEAGYGMIVDATFLRRRDRDRFRDLAHQLGVPFGILFAKADKETLVKRLVERQRRGDDASDAGVAVLEKQLASVEVLGEDELQWVVATGD